MNNSIDISPEQKQFLKTYGVGTVVEVQISSIIRPSQVVTTFNKEFVGRLSVLDISWCLPDGERSLQQFEVGQEIKCVVLAIDFQNKQIKLSQKHLSTPLSDSTSWARIVRGDEYTALILDKLNSSCLVKTSDDLYGLLPWDPEHEVAQEVRVRVNDKMDDANLMSFVDASTEEVPVDTLIDIKPTFNFIEEDLTSYYSFNKSIFGNNATDEDHELIKKGFELDPKIFSKEIAPGFPLYIQFERNSSAYGTAFKQQAIPYFFGQEPYSEDIEQKLLLNLSEQHYWFRLNKFKKDRNKEETTHDFSLYNEEINFYGHIDISRNGKDVRFLIRNFSIGTAFTDTSERKKTNTKWGSFLYTSPIVVLSPLGNLPFGTSQKDVLDYMILKTECFHTINRIKKESGEILRHEGRTLGIIDKFLEYQISLLDDKKEYNAFVDTYRQVPSDSGGITIEISATVGDTLELEGDTVVNIRIKQASLKKSSDEELVKIGDGTLSAYEQGYKITFFKEIRLDILKNGFYIDKRVSKKQYTLQRDIIQDFLEKKIKIDHIESLLVRPDKVRTPQISKLLFKNPDLARTEIEQPDNNQVKAVIKAVGNQNIFLIQGPPGTGKTTVIAEIIEQLTAKKEKILVAGQNHVAVDNVLEKISKVPSLTLLRVGNPDRVDKDLVKYNIDNLVEDYKVDFKQFLNNQVILAKTFLNAKIQGEDLELIFVKFNKQVKEIVDAYGKLKDVYSQRHYILRDGLRDLTPTEIKEAITALEDWITSIQNEYEILLKPMLYNSVDIVFATCIGIKTDQVFKDTSFKFDTVIIDEAGKANIAESLVAMELGKKVILVGDQMQLPPYMDSSLIDESDPESFPKSRYGHEFLQPEIVHALKTSFFEFIINRIHTGDFPKENLELLNYQHRMHPNIGEFISESFYEGRVQMGSRTHLNRLDLPAPFNKEIVFFDTSNSENPYEQKDGNSVKNNLEAESISEIILPVLFNHNVSYRDIAIIAPYKSQVANISKYIQNSSACKLKNIDVSTLDSFQGKEYDIIIFSFTRSANHAKAPVVNGRKKFIKVGFLDDARRLNVAFSRAKKKLILIGNSVTLADPKSHYDGLFNYTQLFTRLIRLSKKEDIGNFFSIADYRGKKSFTNFISTIKPGDKVRGIVSGLAVNLSKIEYGLYIQVGNHRCLAPYNHLKKPLNRNLSSLQKGQTVTVTIIDIDEKFKKITVRVDPEIWRDRVGKIKIGDVLQVEVSRINDFGFQLQIPGGLRGFLNKKYFRGKPFPKERDKLDATVTNIDYEKEQLGFKI
ncbi:AAA domain-containing protein [Taibaiella chishuiensis]|uniref:Superfamily I DNA and/or RNA helicase n=1 Tax=Taibaiella chishuiensis TaxID=1434707 RepID=A0A2P8D4T1_9BACT|nr:AAA domain-containing protein [Taibaiella chishuiensis]PSK92223.1 superfamily I DNA and/or RNA helicase [Taibaiella chishuiensis]